MRSGRLLVGTFAGLLLCGFGGVAWLLLVPAPLALQARSWRALLARRGADAVFAELAQRTHGVPGTSRGASGPCLRYRAHVGWSEAREKRLARLLHHEGLSRRLEGRLPLLVRQWRRQHEQAHHRASWARERVALLEAHARGLDRLLLRWHRRRIVEVLERHARHRLRGVRHAHERLPRARPADIMRLRQLWQRYRLLMSSAYEVSLEIPSRDETTGSRMQALVGRLKHWVTRHGHPPASLADLRLDEELELDGFGSPFDYEIDPETVRVLSPGFDGLRGTADDQIRAFSWPE